MNDPDDLIDPDRERVERIDANTERAMAATGFLMLLWLAGMIAALALGGQ